MPTNNPRVNVTLAPSTDALVSRLAGLTRVSKSQVLRELLEAAEPALQRAAALMEAAQGAAGAVRDRLAHQLDGTVERAEAQLASLLAHQDKVTSDLVATAEAVRGHRPARVSRSGARAGRRPAQNPPASNRGVKSPSKGVSGGKRQGRKP